MRVYFVTLELSLSVCLPRRDNLLLSVPLSHSASVVGACWVTVPVSGCPYPHAHGICVCSCNSWACSCLSVCLWVSEYNCLSLCTPRVQHFCVSVSM